MFFSPAAQLHLSSNPFFLLFVSSLFTRCSPFRLLSYNFTSMVLRLIQPRTMQQSGEQLFSVNSAVILALCISPLILRSATPSCCSPRFDTIWGERAIHARRRPCEVFVCLQLKGRRNTQFLAVRPRDKTLQVFRSRYFTDWPHFSFMPSLGSLQPLER